MNHCHYYQAYVVPAQCWYLTSILRSQEHLCFDRTIDVPNSIFEFFVPDLTHPHFLQLMSYFEQAGIIKNFHKLPNRIIELS